MTMILNSALTLDLAFLIAILPGIVQGNTDCFCISGGLGSYVHCEIADQACLDQTVAPYLQDTLPRGSFGDLSLNCNEDEAIVFPKVLVKEATFTSMQVLCGLSVMEKGTLGYAEATILEARLRLKEVPAFQATRMEKLEIQGPNSLTLTNDTFIGYQSLQRLTFSGYSFINSVEFGTFSVLSNLQSLQLDGACIIYELGPGSLYFNPGSIKEIYLGTVERILPGAISGIPAGVTFGLTKLRNSDISIEIFGGLLYGGSRLQVDAPLNNCKCSAAWIVRDNSSMALNSNAAASLLCMDFFPSQHGPERLSSLEPEDFESCP